MAHLLHMHDDAMFGFDARRLILWLVVAFVPGGMLLLPVLIAEMRAARRARPAHVGASEAPASHA